MIHCASWEKSVMTRSWWVVMDSDEIPLFSQMNNLARSQSPCWSMTSDGEPAMRVPVYLRAAISSLPLSFGLSYRRRLTCEENR
jgi:hypothetical protein